MAIIGKERQLLHLSAVLVENTDQTFPRCALWIADLAQIKHMPFKAASSRTRHHLGDAPVAMCFPILIPTMTLEVHNGAILGKP
jgi:hypothetical protein